MANSSSALRSRWSLPPFIIILALLVLGFWWHLDHPRQGRDAEAAPRPVVARGDLAADEKSVIELFQRVSPSVVYITNVELRRDLFSLNVYEIPQGTGSGYIWDRQGRIVTNYHVIDNASQVTVTLADHSTWKAKIVGVAPDKDLAVLQIGAPPERLHPIMVGQSENLLVGQKVYAIGNPFGLDQTITSGIVSALGREIQSVTGRAIHGVIQTDAAINPGNSGGPLLDSAGRLIGMNTAIYSPSGASAGIGFAVPVDEINRAVPELIRYGRIIQPGLGVAVADDSIAARLGVEGILIVKVDPGTSAAKAGLQGISNFGGQIVLGDIITAINGKPVRSYNEFRDELDRHRVGETVRLTVQRNGRTLEVPVTLEEVG
ncbi:MAG: trypsin-like peptidase domain-containing protein [Desulfobacteraceae bacterium]|nr:trypsin-like peptidase domain-containing protein [Desulfobacteraceae bacterium]